MYKIVIIKFIDKNDQIGYKAFTYPHSITSPTELYTIVNNYIGYQDLYPLDTNITYGKLLETYIRPCSLELSEREFGVQFIVNSNETINNAFPILFPILSNINGIHPTFSTISTQVRSAEHILLQ
jgi:hypothetical protein